ncbi:MAG: hypothetical protein FWC03_12665, partial [Treponema sp.]|nr:hypothetical protein [Treponema sp.]
MQKKRSSRFKAVDLAVIVLCLAGSIVSGTAFWQEYNRTLTKLNEEPVGTIVFKKRTAERKFIDRVVWDRLRETAPVYNGDTIRTIEFSEAVLTFRDEVTYLTLNENTLIQIFYSDTDGARIDFSGGRMEVSSPKTVTVTSGASEIKIEGQANLNLNENGFSLSVIQGEAVFDGEVIETGSIFALDPEGHRDIRPLIAVTSFGYSARVLGEAGAAIPVNFTWNTSNFTIDHQAVVEVARDSSFNNIVASAQTRSYSAVIPVESGNYYWRVYPALAGSREPANDAFPSGTLEAIAVSPLVLVSPANASELAASSGAGISFSWTSVEGASSYIIEISENAGMRNPSVTRNVDGTGIVLESLPVNEWYWRVTPIMPGWITGSASPSGINEFEIVRERPALAPPQLVSPLNDEKVSLDPDDSRQTLVWGYDSNAESWLVEISASSFFQNTIVSRNVSVNYLRMPDDILLDGRTWYWRVTALGGAAPSVSAARYFSVHSVMPIIPPQLPEPEPEPLPPEPEPEPEPPPAAAVTGVTITPLNRSVQTGGSIQFYASVTGVNNPNTAVTWRVSSNAAGTGTVAAGTGISASGLLTISANETPRTLYVTAVSVFDGSMTASATVTVTLPPPVVNSVTVTPVNQSAEAGASIQFYASVTGVNNPNTAVTWRVSSNAAGTGAVASETGISASGLLTISANETHSTLYVTAVSVFDSTKSAGASVTVIRPPEPEPVIVTPVPPVQPVIEPEPITVIPPVVVPAEPVPVVSETQQEVMARLMRVSGTGAVFDIFPTNNYELSRQQLQDARSIDFTWKGHSSEYRYVLYNARGDLVIPPATISGSSYTLNYPGILTEGTYIWQIFEKNSTGNWGTLPSSA